jgi:hypothetical protein
MQMIPTANFYLNPKAIYTNPTLLHLLNKKKHSPAPRLTAAATAVYLPPGAVSRRNRAGADGSDRGAAYHYSCAVYRGRGAANRRRWRGRDRGAADWSCEWADGSILRVGGDRLQAILWCRVLWTVWASWAFNGPTPFFSFFHFLL